MTNEEKLAALKEKEYLGDGVYVAFDEHHVVLTTEDGISATNTVYLEPEVVARFEGYLGRLRAKIEALRKP